MPDIVILTRLGRPSGEEILRRLLLAGERVAAVIAEPRSSLLMQRGLPAFLKGSLRKHGVRQLVTKALGEVRETVRRLVNPGERTGLVEMARKRGIPLYVVSDHNGEECLAHLSSIKPDIVITANTRVLKSKVLAQAAIGTINLHKSKLPQYAGLESIFWALYHGEKKLGVTVHLVTSGIDTGDIICQRTFAVEPGDTLQTLDKKANELGAELMVEAVRLLRAGLRRFTPQDLSKRSYFSWPTPEQRQELARRMPGGRIR
ncbi:MAG: formyl transferase [Bacillota bacterium]